MHISRTKTNTSPKTVDSPIVIKELHIKLHRCNTKQSMENKIICNDESSINSTGQSINTPTSKNIEQTIQKHSISCKTPEPPIIIKELYVKLHRCSLKQIVENKKICRASITSTEQIINTYISKNLKEKTQIHTTTPEASKLNATKKEIRLKSYRPIRWHCTKNYSNVYRNAIKKINIDNNGLFRSTTLREIRKCIKNKDFIKSSIDLSRTYFNIRMYALWKIAPFIEKNILEENILITPGMSVSDLRSSCTSNTNFFKKLQKQCGKIAKSIRASTDRYFSRILQTYVCINYKSHSDSTYKHKRIKFCSNQNKLLKKLKELIINTILNLPSSIICEINRFNQNGIVNSLFSEVHGVLVDNSLIKNIRLFFSSNKNKFINSKFDDNLNLIKNLLEKIENIVGSSYIFHEKVLLPSKPIVKKLSKYLLSDMYGMPDNFYIKLKIAAKNITEHRKSSGDVNQLEQYVMMKEVNLRRYRNINLCSEEFTSIIYEDAIKKIDVDSNEMFIRSVLDKLSNSITRRGITKSSLDLSVTYSNVRRYVLDKISPYIINIITVADVEITPGMSLSDVKHNFISNNVFFEKLRKSCEEIVKNINSIPKDYFSNIVQTYVYSNLSERFRIYGKKNKLCSEVKSLIMDTILNLPNSTIDKLKTFKQSEIIRGLFSDIHGVYITKSLIRKIILISNSNKLPDNKYGPDLNLLNNLLTKVLSEVETYPILHEGKIFSLEKSTAKILSKYLLSDMYKIPAKIRKRLTPNKNIKDNISESNYKKSSATNNDDDNIEPSLLEKPILIPQKKLKWETDLVSPLNIYKSALSMVDIDKADFEYSFIDIIKNYPSVTKHLSKKGKINADLSTTYSNVKNYILETFSPFLKEIEKETRAKIKITNGMTIDELKLIYASNKEFLDKLRKFCTKVINRINSSRNTTLSDLVQFRIPLRTEISKVIRVNKKRKNLFLNETENLLVKNILNIPKAIVNTIKLISNTKFIEEHFSNFYDIYVDNVSLLKAKSVFDYVNKKVANDHLLIKIADKISLNMDDKIREGNRIGKIINSNISR
ncbi:hypothetical protein Ark11_1485 [Candidatus Ichthyocystis hellenicum]|uniref:Uncharacterized protein n=1 Tax=Candidatus Ichthyocystis hellenicum TaxID=1561003 RepID=A0A0S4M4Q0_9BURK|nr:hypothetical protein [Candidatus Ichthyocystis hellenicum]CUT18283.1 hypothetical protein Ark11_1485 [Candidatus Ichthyocystis hellenicum]